MGSQQRMETRFQRAAQETICARDVTRPFGEAKINGKKAGAADGSPSRNRWREENVADDRSRGGTRSTARS